MEDKKSESILKKVLTFIIVLLIGWSVIYIVVDPTKKEEPSDKRIKEQLKRVEEVLYKLDEEYMGEVDYNKAGTAAIASILEATGDPYTRYLEAEEFNEIANAGLEEYGGIGVHLSYNIEKKIAVIVSAMPNTPADKAGIEIGDYLLKVNDIEVKDLESYSKAAEELRGEPNTSVKVTLLRNEEVVEKTIVREVIKVNNVTSNMFDNNIGYIKILQFENKVYDEFKTEYDMLKEKNMKGLIIDLRNNPGGMVDETVKIADMLLPDGDVIVKTVYKNGDIKVEKGKDGKKADLPIIVLVNEQSASASEILAGALKDYDAATLMGQKTYGKGIVQGIEMLKKGDGISITIAKYYTKKGAEIHKKGIEPNIKIDVSEEEKKKIAISIDKDTMLIKAVEEMKNKIK